MTHILLRTGLKNKTAAVSGYCSCYCGEAPTRGSYSDAFDVGGKPSAAPIVRTFKESQRRASGSPYNEF
jgi:hypothetical protein